MALLFCEGFDGYIASGTSITSNTSLGQFWDENQQAGSNSVLSTSSGRNGTYGYQAVNSQNYIGKILTANYSRLILGLAYAPAAFGGGVVQFLDGTTSQVWIRCDGSGQIAVYRSNSVLLGTTALSVPFAIGAHRYVEVDVEFSNSAAVTVRVDGTTELSLAGVDTTSTANSYANRVRFGPANTFAGNGHFDDIYLCDTSGTINDTFLGDVRVQALLPNGNGNSSQWVGSDGNSTDNYLLVDEVGTAGANGDTDYVTSGTVSNKDTYAYGNLTPTSGTVLGVQIMPSVRKDDAGARAIKTVARLSGGTEADGPSRALSTSYTYQWDVRETKPGGGAWSIADVNGAEFGIKVDA